jgi:hypothetical protein
VPSRAKDADNCTKEATRIRAAVSKTEEYLSPSNRLRQLYIAEHEIGELERAVDKLAQAVKMQTEALG